MTERVTWQVTRAYTSKVDTLVQEAEKAKAAAKKEQVPRPVRPEPCYFSLVRWFDNVWTRCSALIQFGGLN